MTTPTPPNGYTPYEPYEIPAWGRWTAVTLLGGISVALVFWLDVTLIAGSPVVTAVGATLGISTTVFLHESLHYVTDVALGYSPVYQWPTMVYISEKSLSRVESTVSLLTPQLLSIIYFGILVVSVPPALQVALGWGLIINLAASSSDVSWVVRRWTWPPTTRLVVGDDLQNYVAFPEE